MSNPIKEIKDRNEATEMLQIIAEFTGADRGNFWELCGRDMDAWTRAERFRDMTLPEAFIQRAMDYCNDRLGEGYFTEPRAFMEQFTKSQNAARDAIEQYASELRR